MSVLIKRGRAISVPIALPNPILASYVATT